MSTVRLLDIVDNTIVDGPGLRISLYFAGCNHACPGCHNPESWDFHGGKDYTIDEVVDIIVDSGKKKITFSGGDPLYQPEALYELCAEIKKRIPGANLWLYTGFDALDLIEGAYRKGKCLTGEIRYRTIVKYIDVLVDGPYIEKYRDENLKFRGSSNQHIIQVNSDFVKMFRRNIALKHYVRGDVDLDYIKTLEGDIKFSKILKDKEDRSPSV